jgi:hypothetical protein
MNQGLTLCIVDFSKFSLFRKGTHDGTSVHFTPCHRRIIKHFRRKDDTSSSKCPWGRWPLVRFSSNPVVGVIKWRRPFSFASQIFKICLLATFKLTFNVIWIIRKFSELVCHLTAAIVISYVYTLSQKKADFRKYRGGSPLERKFTVDSRKLGIISSDYWEISPSGDFLPNTLGNLLCFRDSVEIQGSSHST